MATSFPLTPYLNQIIHRHDLLLTCQYDGTRWLTTGFIEATAVPRSAVPLSADGLVELASSPSYNRRLISVVIDSFVFTTNTTSNYWTFTPRNGITGDSLATAVSTQFHAPNAWNSQTISLTSVAALASKIDVFAQRVGSPGTLLIQVLFRYQLVIT